MTTRTAAPAGSPCWTDLWTSDIAGSRAFYPALFGWEAGEPGPEFGGYFMCTRGGIPVAGAMGDMGDLSADNSWKIHLATGDIEATMAQWRPRVAGRHIPRVHRARGARRPRLVRALHP